MQTLTVGNHYDFSVYANSTLGTSHKNLRLASILDYQSALRSSNVVLLHKHILPYLPAGTPSDPTKYTYYRFLDQNGKESIFANVWIVENTITINQGVSHTLRLNNVNASQLTLVRDQLRLLGISFDFL